MSSRAVVIWLLTSGVYLLTSGCARPTSNPKSQIPNPKSDILIIGSHGTAPGQFIKPRVCAVDDKKGWLYVTDTSGRIQKFTLDGEYLIGWKVPEIERGRPEGIALGKDGSVFIADTHYSRILKYSPDGKLLKMWGEHGDEAGKFDFPMGLTVDRDGNVYVSEYGGVKDTIQVFDADGHFLRMWGKRGKKPGEFQRPMGMAFDSQGFLYVCDAVNHRVQKFTKSGKLVAWWGKAGTGLGELKYPYGIVVLRGQGTRDKGQGRTPRPVSRVPCPKGGGVDTVFVLEFGNNRIQEFTPGGKAVRLIGRGGRGIGEFASPWGLAVSQKGFLFVADTYNHRVQRIPLLLRQAQDKHRRL